VVSVTLDSNVSISALNYGGPPLRLLNLAREGMIRLDVSDAILEEFAGVLRDKFRWSDEDIADAQHEIMFFANHVTPVESLTVVAADADDDRILECAAAARSDYLVTGDKHLLRLGSHRGTRIVKAAEFLAIGRER
jgi:putative PIN family toxin of toxin-antitoxin system